METGGGKRYDIRKERLDQKSGNTDFINDNHEEFRDTLGTVDETGKRIWIYPKKPSGKYHQWRIAVTVILLSFLFGVPFIKIGGQPFLLFNLFERKFVIFGQAFWPQDFALLAIMLITFFVFIILFTVVFGRVWCGWMCPQTLFMEMVFRKIEYLIEGDASAQRRLAKASWTFDKVWKKTLKHLLFMIISILIAHTVMAYLIGVDKTLAIVHSSPFDKPTGFIGLTAFTLIFYGVYAKFREQACIAVCPYGRLQGVLLIKSSIVVAYDWLRGEPRGHIKKNNEASGNQGDCIDCNLCYHVCPTGIDIRNGTQLECVNCTACIDACDDVMLKIGKPTGLIRFASYNAIKEGVSKIITSKIVAYSFVLFSLVGVLSFSLITRSIVETTVFKVPGTLYQREGNIITNLYNIEFVNKTFNELSLEIKIEDPVYATLSKVDGSKITLPSEGLIKNVMFIKIPEDEIRNARTVVLLGVYQNGKLIETVKVKFIGPVHQAIRH
jgi:cytochrome c oxidase accessory protein FixG